MLSLDDFADFFAEVHGYPPFPWQKCLLAQVVADGKWPSMLDLPTGSGKTATIDIAVFHLALEADRGEARQAPVRIAFVVDRRLVVDDAFERAKKLASALRTAKLVEKSVTWRVANSLRGLALDGPPLLARRLRGGIPQEDDWARTPSQPTVLCSTVDQIGSRLLFRGYGVSDSMKPVHAGLIGSDCMILLDEAHLAEPFRQTLDWVGLHRGPDWRESGIAGPWGISLLTATPHNSPPDTFSLYEEDKSHPILSKRLNASKPVRLVTLAKPTGKTKAAGESDNDENDGANKDLARRVTALVGEIRCAINHFKEARNGVATPAIGVVVNRIVHARKVFEQLRREFREHIEAGLISEPILMIGPARPVDRDALAEDLNPIRTGAPRQLERPFILIATQCIETGVDIDLDALITEIAALDALRQRFGRLNRAGRDIVPYGAIIATNSDISSRAKDPVYGMASKKTWDRLVEAAQKSGTEQIVELGLAGFSVPIDKDVLSPKEDAPILLPAHLDLLSHTSPIPTADPDIGIYLHGASRQPDSVTVVWRGDIVPDVGSVANDTRHLLMIVPPRSLEAIELPIWTVRRWLEGVAGMASELADAPMVQISEEAGIQKGQHHKKIVFRWRGNNADSCWIEPSELRPGDTIVVPANYGGIDEFGWNPEHKPAMDVALAAAQPFAGRRFAVRVTLGLAGQADAGLADALANAESGSWRDLRDALLELPLPNALRTALEKLSHARRKKGTPVVVAYPDIYGRNEQGHPRGIIFLAPFGLKGRVIDETDGEGVSNTTEDDWAGSLAGYSLALEAHNSDVGCKAESFAKASGLPSDRIADLKLAGLLHDLGKGDARFQSWLHFDDPLGFDDDEQNEILAKSGRSLPRSSRTKAGLPDRWRHEALSVRIARTHDRLRHAKDPDLVLWLIGSHHGYGRPFFPHQDPQEKAPDIGPQSLAFDLNGLDWPSLFVKLKARYGLWELARMEAILRLADHRASVDARNHAATEDGE